LSNNASFFLTKAWFLIYNLIMIYKEIFNQEIKNNILIVFL